MFLNSLQIRIPLTLRNIVLRILLMGALAGIPTAILAGVALLQFGSVSAISMVGSVIFPLLLILHHTLRLWPRKWWLVICEVVISLAEVVTTGYFYAPVLPVLIKENVSGEVTFVSLSLSMLYGASLFVMAIFSFVSFLFLLSDILNDHGRNILCPYDFSVGMCQPGRQWSFICGRFVMQKRFSTDTVFIRSIRGGLAIVCLPMMVALVIYTFVLQPVEWSGRQNVKLSKIAVRNGDLYLTLQESIRVSPWNVPPLQAILKVLNVSVDQHPTMTMMVLDRDSQAIVPIDGCWNNTGAGTVFTYCPFTTIPTQSDDFIDILFTIYFPAGAGDFRVYLGMTTSTDDILAEAEPIGITPGSNVHGWSSFSVKERFSGQKAAAIGILQYRRFAVINIGALSPDLLPSLPRDNSTATIRVTVQSQRDLEIEQEYLEGSVLNGFAFVGGIWTLVNGTFAAVFGSTLLLVLFGIKPLSIYGLVHLFRPGKGSLVDGGLILSPEERDRIVGILREHLLDVEDGEGDGTRSSVYHSVGVLPRFSRSRARCDVGVQT